MFMVFPLSCHINNIKTTSYYSLITKNRSQQIKRYCLLVGSTAAVMNELDSPSYIKKNRPNIQYKKEEKFST
jgi:hypothetical protein